jgi:hypothetical protein
MAIDSSFWGVAAQWTITAWCGLSSENAGISTANDRPSRVSMS